MKVMLVGTDSSMSGAGLSMIALADNLRQLGVDIVLVVKNGNTEKVLSDQKVDHYVVNCQSWMYSTKSSIYKRIVVGCIKRLLNIPAYYKYKKIIGNEDPDIVHVNAGTSGCASIAALRCNKKLVWHIREMMEEDLGASFANSDYSKKYISKANAVICISDVVYNKFRALLPDVSMYKIYNGIDIAKYYSDKSIFNGDKVILTIAGRIDSQKGQYEVVRGVASILKQYDSELWIVGDGNPNEIDRIKAVVELERIPPNRILFWGRVDNMSQIWGKTDIALVASKFEAFGRVTIEAMAAGCLVIGANTGGTTELIQDGVTGLLYKQGDSYDLSYRIEYAINHMNEMQTIASNGREYASKEFTAMNNAEKVLSVYNAIIE